MLGVAIAACGCIAGSPNQPDEIVIRNEREVAASGFVELFDSDGARLINQSFSLAPGANATFEVGLLRGNHLVVVTTTEERVSRSLTLEPIREYIQVYVGSDDIAVLKIHGD